MKKIVYFLLAVLMMFSFVGCQVSNENENTDDKSSVNIGKSNGDVFEIKTDYCILKYPNKWKDDVTIEVVSNVVSFTHNKTGARVFDIVFGNGDGYLLGVLEDDKISKEVKVNSYELDNSNEYFKDMCGMQIDVNVIIEHLSKDYKFNIGE